VNEFVKRTDQFLNELRHFALQLKDALKKRWLKNNNWLEKQFEFPEPFSLGALFERRVFISK